MKELRSHSPGNSCRTAFNISFPNTSLLELDGQTVVSVIKENESDTVPLS